MYPRISCIFRGALRIHGTKPVRKRTEITKDILLAAIATFDSTTFDDLNLHTAFCVAFAAFLRPSEVTWDLGTQTPHRLQEFPHSQSNSPKTGGGSSTIYQNLKLTNIGKEPLSLYSPQMIIPALFEH